MKFISYFVFLLSLNFGFGHDLRMAIFEIYRGDQSIEISISLDRDAFLRTLQSDCSESLIEHGFGDAVWEYLDSHFKVTVNSYQGSLDILEIEYSEQNLIVKGSLNIPLEEVREIQEVRMINTCMVDIIDGHDNVVKLSLNDRFRSFRMNKERTSTFAIY